MGNRVVDQIKSALPARRWRAIRRATNRLRWILKYKLLRQYGFPIAQRPARALRYILWDPEVESFSYELANEPQYAEFISGVLGEPREQVIAWMEEAKRDPVLNRDRGFHWSSKRRQPMGNRLMWYPIVRATKPRVIVEAGVHEGLGSEVLLAALERNEREGFPGKLISFDIHEDTGWLVAPHLKKNWQFVLESTLTGMARVLREQDLRVDMFIHETLHTDETVRTEMDAVLRHAGPQLVVVDSSGMLLPTLRQYCQLHETQHHYFLDRPKDHIVTSYGTAFAVFHAEKTRPGPNTTAARSGQRRTTDAEQQTNASAITRACVAATAVSECLGGVMETALALV
jgi:hypothetical protein